MLKKFVPVLAATALTAVAAVPSAHAFDVGGANGWKFSTDGIVDVFATYQSAQSVPGGDRSLSFLNAGPGQFQHFSVQVGLLPSVVGLNIAAPTTNGIDSKVRIGIYPSIQNSSHGGNANRFETNPNIDFREIYYTASGKFGELLAGRALNLYQGKNILTDMTLLGVGVVPIPATTTTLGHIAYGYLYTNFGPQIRYTTPDMGGVKAAISVNEPYNISSDTSKTATPRVEGEISYAGKLAGGITLSSWVEGLYQDALRSSAAAARPGKHNHSLGGAAGVQTGLGNLDLLASGYYGEGLGMVSVQDGSNDAAWGSSAVDGAGLERTQWGWLAQATYKLTPSFKVGVNYGQTAQDRSNDDRANIGTGGFKTPMRKQEAATVMLAYNLNAFTQFVGEYSWAQNTWMDDQKQHANSVSIGTMFYW